MELLKARCQGSPWANGVLGIANVMVSRLQDVDWGDLTWRCQFNFVLEIAKGNDVK